MKKEIKKFIFNYGIEILVAILSIITLIIGTFIIKFIPSLILVLILDIIWFSPEILRKFRKVKINDYRDKEIIRYQNEVRNDNVKKISSNKNKKKTNNNIKNTNNKNKKNNKVNKKEINNNVKKKSKKMKVFKIFLIIMLTLFIIGCLLGFGFMFYIVENAPKFDAKNLYHQESTLVYDKNGTEIAKLGSENREIITYDEVSEELVNAIVATEDSKFFEHNGFDASRFLVASAKQLTGNSSAGGASTLTMQVVKNHYTSTNASGIKGIIRKFTDIYMSIFMVEKEYDKKEIFEFYINSNYLGSGAYGVEAASHNYFGKSANELNVAEAALIAGLFQAPTSYDPYNHPEAAEKRRQTVLKLMERHGYITEKEKEAAQKMTVEKLLNKEKANNETEYQAYIDVVAQEVLELTGDDIYMTSMKVYTNMDANLQKNMNKIMSGETFNFENAVINAGITIIDNDTGAISAVGGGRHSEGAKSFSTAIDTKRQIGSTAKPLYDYAPGIEYENWSTYTPWIDEPYKYSNGPSITNWDGGYKGFITTRDALIDSRNVPALKAFQANKNSNIKKFVQSVGLSPENPEGSLHEAHAIGGYNGESPTTLAGAYSSFANGGNFIEPHSVVKIQYRNSDKVIKNEKVKTRVMSDATAYMMTDMLAASVEHNMGRYKYINGATYTAKTGTTNFSEETKKANGLASNAINDLWCVGYNPEYTIAVWYGYDKIDKNHYTRFGNREHTRLFQAVGKFTFTNTAGFTRPKSVVDVAIEYGSNPGMLPSSSTPSDKIITALFKAGTEPTTVSPTYIRLGNVNNLKGTIDDDKTTLSWAGVAPLTDISTEGFGNLGYDIYRKDGDNLTHVKFTTSTSFSESIDSDTDNVTYVVKATYEDKKEYASSGTTISLEKIENVKLTLKGNNPLVFDIADTEYTEPGIIVTADGKQLKLNEDYNLTFTIDDNKSFKDIAGTEGTYTVNYKIVYKNKTYTTTRTIKIK